MGSCIKEGLEAGIVTDLDTNHTDVLSESHT
jgi:hypothetical protein